MTSFTSKPALFFILVSTLILFTGCSSKGPYQLYLMPAPDAFDDGAWQPFTDTPPFNRDGYIEMLYATGRKPADGENQPPFYKNKRGYCLRLGKGSVKLGKGRHTWEEMKKISLLKNRTEKLPLQVTRTEELGILSSSISEFLKPEIFDQKFEDSEKKYAETINRQLEKSRLKDIYIYVHGFKVNFENPLIVASELWHYLGYNGSFIAYAWPSTPSLLAYASDAETTVISSRNLRLFLEFLARETIAEEIHLIGYSAGTRLVVNALHSLSLIHSNLDRQSIHEKLKIGNVILLGSDIDTDIFVSMLHDNLLNVPRHFNIYMSSEDQALGFSNWFFSRKRLGQFREIQPHVTKALLKIDNLDLIDVSDASGATDGNGHGYFRKSPWVSSDLLVTLSTDMTCEQRGLIQRPQSPVWYFPENFQERLRSIIDRKMAENHLKE